MIALRWLTMVIALSVCGSAFAEEPPAQSWNPRWKELVTEDSTSWEDQGGHPFRIRDFSSGRVVLTMAYTQCKKTCPMITLVKLKKMQKLYDEKHWKADFFVITLDPEGDTVEVLRKFQVRMGLDRDNWHFIRTNKSETRLYAKKLGLGGYWEMDDHIQHEFKIWVLDSENKKIQQFNWANRDEVPGV